MGRVRKDSDEYYVLELVAEVIRESCLHGHTFEILVGDARSGRRARKLPVDGYFPGHRLVVEYHERQHTESVPIMDKRMTVSGVPRGEQRRRYDRRKRDWAADNRLAYLAIPFGALEQGRRGRLERDKARDRATIASLLRRAGVLSPSD